MVLVPLLRGVDESTLIIKRVRREARLVARLAEASMITLAGAPSIGVPSPICATGTLWATVVTPVGAPTLILTSAGGPQPLFTISA